MHELVSSLAPALVRRSITRACPIVRRQNTAHGRSTSVNTAYSPIREQQREQLVWRIVRLLPALS
jgi:hypothetical protein